MFQESEHPVIDLATIGRTMSRERRQTGWVEKTGKKTKSWTGYWYVYVPIQNGEEKRRRRKKALGRCSELTKGAAEDALLKFIRESEASTQQPAKPKAPRKPTAASTFAELAARYIAGDSPTWSKKWQGTVKGFFKLHILPELGERIAAEIENSDVQLAINAIGAKPNCQSASMLQKCVVQIRAVYKDAIKNRTLQYDPVVSIKLPPTRKASERFLTLDECRRLLEVAPPRDNLIIRLFMVLGFRPGELFALRLDDYVPSDGRATGRLRIDQTVVDYKLEDGAKTEASEAELPLSPALELHLREYIRENNITDLLFPSEASTPISPDNYLDRILKVLGVKAGIDVYEDSRGKLTSRLNHQVLRRTTATHFQRHGKIKDTQGLLRHTKPQTTLEYYQKRLEESTAHAVDQWDQELVATSRKGPGTEVISIDERRKVN